MTEPARQRAAAKPEIIRKADVAAKTNTVITEKETALAAKTERAKDIDITASTRITKAVVAVSRKKSKKSGSARTTRLIDGAMARE